MNNKIYNWASQEAIEATKNRDVQYVRVLKNLKAELEIHQKSSGSELTEEQEIKVIQGMIKVLKKDIKAYGNRKDLVSEASYELSVLETLVPGVPGEEAIKQAIDSWTGSFDKASMGKIIGHVKKLLPEAPGELVAELVRGYL